MQTEGSADPLPQFVSDAGAELERIEQAMLSLQQDPGDRTALTQLAQAARGIKNRAAALGMRGIVVEAQRIEWWAAEPAATRGSFATLNGARLELRRLVDVLGGDLDFVP